MKRILQVFGLFLIVAGISLFFTPDFIFDWIYERKDNQGIYFAAIGARLVLGSLLLTTASQGKFPITIRVLGVISILAAFLFLLMGSENFVELISNLLPLAKPYAWVSGFLSIGFGVFLVSNFMGEREP